MLVIFVDVTLYLEDEDESLYSVLTTYDNPLAVVMPYANTNTNPDPNVDPNLKHNSVIINLQNDMVHFSGRPDTVFILADSASARTSIV